MKDAPEPTKPVIIITNTFSFDQIDWENVGRKSGFKAFLQKLPAEEVIEKLKEGIIKCAIDSQNMARELSQILFSQYGHIEYSPRRLKYTTEEIIVVVPVGSYKYEFFLVMI